MLALPRKSGLERTINGLLFLRLAVLRNGGLSICECGRGILMAVCFFIGI